MPLSSQRRTPPVGRAIDLLNTALAYAARGVRVFPCHSAGERRKTPLTPNGYRDATGDPVRIKAWWRRWPTALIGTPTGRDFVVLDVDKQHGGFETLANLGFATLPLTMTARTPSGGCHLYFAVPEQPIRNTQGAQGNGIGRGLDWRGQGGYVILPAPGTGYEWVTDTLAVERAAVPAELMPADTGIDTELVGTAHLCDDLSPYGEAALSSAAEKILSAPNGEQEATLNGQSYSIGRLAGAGHVPVELALEVLLAAAKEIPSYDPRRPWRPDQIESKVRRAFAQGLVKPRPDLADLMRELDRLGL